MVTSTRSQIAPQTGAGAPELIHALRFLTLRLQSLFATQARAHGLGLIEFLVLASLASEAQGAPPYEVGRAFGLRSSTMTGVADRLERAGLIRRAPHPSDRRLLLLQATSEGHTLLERSIGPVVTGVAAFAETLDPDALEVIGMFAEDAAAVIGAHAGARATPDRAAGGVHRAPASET